MENLIFPLPFTQLRKRTVTMAVCSIEWLYLLMLLNHILLSIHNLYLYIYVIIFARELASQIFPVLRVDA